MSMRYAAAAERQELCSVEQAQAGRERRAGAAVFCALCVVRGARCVAGCEVAIEEMAAELRRCVGYKRARW